MSAAKRYTLITGASGLIGRALTAALAPSQPVLAMSRRDPGLDVATVRGDFTDFEDLRHLDGYEIGAVVHLGAVTGGSTERDALRVNVEGTRRLMRYLVDRGCRRFVLASSIAVVGLADAAFRPVGLPMADDHPCLARDAYGLSKSLMEQVAAYFARREPDLDVLCLRLASVTDDPRLPPLREMHPLRNWAMAGITVMALSDAVRLLALALEAPARPGFRIRNAAPARAWVAVPTADLLQGWYEDDVDLSWFRRPGHEFGAVFDVGRISAELGFAGHRPPSTPR